MVTPAKFDLGVAPWLQRPETRQLFRLLDGTENRSRVVGGIVRDTLLGRERPENDIDFATELLPAEVMARAGAAGVASYPTGIEHGTVTLKLGELLAEVTTLREDVTTDGRHAVVAFGTDWRRDAERRDFTMNALYAGMDGALFDPLAGVGDCLARRVRFIGDPDQRIAEDRLRVFRFFRFCASHGDQRFDADGLAACRRAAGELGRLSAERIGTEMKRMLSLPRVATTLEVMAQCGVLALPFETLVLLSGYEERADPPAFAGRLAVIMLRSDAATVQRLWRLGNADISAAKDICDTVPLIVDGQPAQAAYRFPAAVNEAAAIAAAIGRWDAARLSRLRSELVALKVPAFPLTGGDLVAIGYRPGPALGRELKRLETLWVDSRFGLSRAELLEAATAP